MPTRSQLTLFVPQSVAAQLEAIRRVVDPIQQRLIPAHVTLCREDEIAGIDEAAFAERVSQAPHGPVTLEFGPAERFAEHGILLPCISGLAVFQSLREAVLASPQARPHTPHLTLAHPRNPRTPGNTLESAVALRDGLRVTFDTIHLITQTDDAPWVVRAAFPLRAHQGHSA